MPESKRQLAAIMFTDIVGYTKLMGEDEMTAYTLLQKNRKVQKPLIVKHQGIWLKEMGDGILASFQAVSDAVYCAIEIQEKCQSEPDLKLRIGIHLGEVIVEDRDVFGDGVNIASRLEPLAPAGGIYISEAVFRNIENKKGIDTGFVKEEMLKNVKHPVRIYEVKAGERQVEPKHKPSPSSVVPKGSKKLLLKKAGIVTFTLLLLASLVYILVPKESDPKNDSPAEIEKSIAVRPFWNESSDEENEYFVNGMTEDIRNNLAKVADMRVISRGSMEKYRETELSTREIASELDVSYLLEGTVQKLGNQVKIHAQLILANVDNHIWEDTYVRELNDASELFKVQSDIAQIIATELNASISADEKKRLEIIPTSDITAYDYVLKADQTLHDFWMTSDIKYLNASYDLYYKAFQKDPEFPRALLGMAQVFLRRSSFDSTYHYIERAIQIDPANANAIALKGHYLNAIGQMDQAFDYFLMAYDLAPNEWAINFVIGDMCFRYKNDIVNGLSFMQKAHDLNTENRDQMYLNIGQCYFHIGDFEKAEYYFEKAMELNVGCAIIMSFGWMYHNMGQFDEAIQFYDSKCDMMDCELLCSLQRFYTNLYLKNYSESLYQYQKALQAGREPDHQLDRVTVACLYDALEQYQKADSILESVLSIEVQNINEDVVNQGSYLMLACVYALQNDKTKAIENLLKYEEFGFTVWSNEIKIYPAFESLWNEPEFEAIVGRMEQEKAMLRAKIRSMEEKGEISF